MIDGIIKGDGTSRLIKSVSDFKSRYPTYDDFVSALVDGTITLDILFNADGWSQQPDFLNKSSLLKDKTAELYKSLPENPIIDDVFNILSKAALVGSDGVISTPGGIVVTQTKLEYGSYIGTGRYGSGGQNRITFNLIDPKIVFVTRSENVGASAMFIKGSSAGNIFFSNELYVPMCTFGAKTLSWYLQSKDANYQLNQSGVTYYYLGIE